MWAHLWESCRVWPHSHGCLLLTKTRTIRNIIIISIQSVKSINSSSFVDCLFKGPSVIIKIAPWLRSLLHFCPQSNTTVWPVSSKDCEPHLRSGEVWSHESTRTYQMTNYQFMIRAPITSIIKQACSARLQQPLHSQVKDMFDCNDPCIIEWLPWLFLMMLVQMYWWMASQPRWLYLIETIDKFDCNENCMNKQTNW